MSKHYILGNYQSLKNQKKSSAIKDVIFVANDFVGNVLLSLNTIFSEVLLLTIICIVGCYFNFKVTLIAIIVLGLILYITKKYNQKAIENINKTRIRDYSLNISNLNNLLNGYLSIKKLDLIHQFLEKFRNSNKSLNHNYAILYAKRVNLSKQTEIIMIILLCSLLIYIQFFKVQTQGIIIFLSVFVALLFKAIPSVNKLSLSSTNLNAHIYSLEVLEKKITNITKVKSSEKALDFEHSIALKNISFYYEKKSPILDNFNLTIKKSDFIAFSGRSGIGKTTLLNIITKLMDPVEGSVYLDDIEINSINKYVYFNLITYLTQKPFVFEGTIKDNLLINQDFEDSIFLEQLLSSLDLKEVIDKLPNKENTYIGLEATNLSGGELQRLCIARALLQKPEILVLDEATNNLDLKTEKKVLEFLLDHAQKNNITVIAVSHQLENFRGLFTHVINL
ncbi:ABC transporter ATP-binding protein [Aquimarina sp. MMG016]|uniref:ATP-binding cassette domain-containing protein n=1 Tax=Aquimarina sp. MMG016 TaxID=2822690 RepID=UPI001B3A0893|nr:ABC transporter ATP-binding protein [Aquimarina sp. MMG016]MBQ4821778.1 ABC transporter ATP-binding protein [Aquimarina sp. MMG016]